MSQATLCEHCQAPVPDGASFCPACGGATPTRVHRSTGRAEVTPPLGDTTEHRARLQRLLGDEFRLDELIGQGGFGAVYAAHDMRLDREVAVKAIRDDLFASAQILDRFQREARAVAKIRHPNVLPIYSVGGGEGLAYMIMPRIRGESLRAKLDRGTIPVVDAVRIAVEVAGALAAAHEAGVIHRDVKPENILLDGPDQRALLMDFGIAKAVADTDHKLTGTGMLVGTPAYMSPEQASGERDLDSRTDIYALGCVLYEMLAGATPFGGSSMLLIGLHISEPPRPVDAANPKIPFALARVVDRALAKKREARFAGAADFAQALKDSLVAPDRAVASAEAAPVWNRPLEHMAFQLRHRLTRVPGWWRRRQRWQQLLMLAGLLVAGVLVAAPESFTRTFNIIRFTLSDDPRATQAAASAPAGEERGPPSLQAQPVRLSVVGLGDTALAIVTREHGGWVRIFDGERWTQVAAPTESNRWLAIGSRGGLLLLPHRPGFSWRLEGSRLVRAESVPIGVASAWSNGDAAVAGGLEGELAVFSRGQWRRLASGRQNAILAIFGSQPDDLRALGMFASGVDRPDSVLSFDGFAWQSHDPRQQQSQYWVYEAGLALRDGSILVVGSDESVGASGPLLLRQPASETTWRLVDMNWHGDRPRILGIAEVDSTLYLWGINRADGAAGPQLWEVTGDDARRITALHLRAVAGVAGIRGRPFVVTGDGMVWSRGRSTWGVASPSPDGGELAAAATGRPALRRLGHASFDLGMIVAATGWSGARRITNEDNNTFWVVRHDGRLARVDCTPGCTAQAMPSPAGPRDTVFDLVAVPNRGLVAVGTSGLIATWRNGRWQREAFRAAPAGTAWIRIDADTAGHIGLLGRGVAARVTPDGRFERLGATEGEPIDLAIGPRQQLAILTTAGLWTADSTLEGRFNEPRRGMQFTALGWLPNGALVLTASSPDPLLGGAIYVARGNSTREYPSNRALTALLVTERSVMLSGSGWFVGGIPFPQLGL